MPLCCERDHMRLSAQNPAERKGGRSPYPIHFSKENQNSVVRSGDRLWAGALAGGGEIMAKILVLDDEADACELIERIFSGEHDVRTFTDERSAIDFARDHQVDLAILDIKLKEMSGVEVLAILKENSPNLKAIMLTGYPTLETARQSITMGAHEYLVKPIDIDEIEAKVKRVLSAQRKRAKGAIQLDG